MEEICRLGLLTKPWMSSDEAAQFLFEKWRGSASEQTPLRVAFSGFPFAGKTTLAHKMVSLFGAAVSCHIPIESFIISRLERERLNINGCSPRAYNLDGICSCLDSVGAEIAVELPVYDWSRGELGTGTISVSSKRGGIAIIDGTAIMPLTTQDDMLQDSRQAGATFDVCSFAISPAMENAGRHVLESHLEHYAFSHLVREVYTAMERVKVCESQLRKR